MGRQKIPSTPALRALREAGVAFEVHIYDYVPRGGTAASADALGFDEHRIVKTLVMEDHEKAPLIILMHGDRQVSTQALARQVGAKTVRPCKPDIAQRHTGYQVGGTSPFGLKKALPIYAERTIADLARLVINGGARGVLVELAWSDLQALLSPTLVDAARP